MDYIFLLVALTIFWTLYNVITTIATRRNPNPRTADLPPGPYPFPVIGSIHKLGSNPHQSLTNLSKTYGPIMSLKLGTITTIVISSPSLAKQILHTHDLPFSSRSTTDASRAYDHHHESIVLLPVGDKWRNLRKLVKEHVFGSHVLEAGQLIRRKSVDQLLDYVRNKCSDTGDPIDIGVVAFTTSLNVLSNLFFSVDLASLESNLSQEFRDIVLELMHDFGKPNFADYFPVLQMVDPQGLRRKADAGVAKVFGILDRIIDGRLEERRSLSGDYCAKGDVLDSLLSVCEKNDWGFSYKTMKHLLSELFTAGTDTNSSTVEWAMSELLHNPEKMAKARSELKQITGNNNIIQESDIPKLPYLHAIIKETLRLHPPVPFLVPRKTKLDINIEGFTVPKNAQLLVNVWAIGRDSGVWSNPESFMPERFLDCEIDYKGKHFELIPFGAGRRMCPGISLAYRLMHLVLGSLIHSFEWKLEGGVKAEDMDMSDKFGFTLQKAHSLKAIPFKY